MQTPPAAVLDATPIPGPFRTDGRRHDPRSIGEALLGAAEARGHEEDRAVKRTPEELIAAVIDLMSRLLRDDRSDVEDLRAEARALLQEISMQMQTFGRTRGPSVRNPVNRAWYLLNEALEHRTLLREPEGGAS